MEKILWRTSKVFDYIWNLIILIKKKKKKNEIGERDISTVGILDLDRFMEENIQML